MDKVIDSGKVCWSIHIGIAFDQLQPFFSPHLDLTVQDFQSLFPNATYTLNDNPDSTAFIFVTDLRQEEQYWVYRKDNRIYSPVMEVWLDHFFEDLDILPSYFILLD
jgi:hypothetical protein